MIQQISRVESQGLETYLAQIKFGEVSIARWGSFLNLNYVITEHGRALVTGRGGTWGIDAEYFEGWIRGIESNEQTGLPDNLIPVDEVNLGLPNNNSLSRQLRVVGDIEDVVTRSTRERWDYMNRIARGKIEIIKSEELSEGEFIVTTCDGRMLYGRNETLECELDPLTLQEKKDEFIHASVFVNFDHTRGYSGKGYNGKRNNNKCLLRTAECVYKAMLDIATGNSRVFEYELTKATTSFKDQLIDVQRTRDVFGEDLALALARKYSNNNGSPHNGKCKQKKISQFKNQRPLQAPKTPTKEAYLNRPFNPMYVGNAPQSLDIGAGLAYMLLGPIASGNPYSR